MDAINPRQLRFPTEVYAEADRIMRTSVRKGYGHFTSEQRDNLLIALAHQLFRKELERQLMPLYRHERILSLISNPPRLMLGVDGKYHTVKQDPSDEVLQIRAHIQMLTLQLAESYGLRPYPHCTTPEQPANLL